MFNRKAIYDTTGMRVLIAMNLAAALGALIVAAILSSFSIPSVGELAELVPVYLFAHLIWFFGIALVGGPIWLTMHQFGLRHWSHAGLAGCLVLTLGCMATMTRLFTGYSNSLVEATSSPGQWIWKDHYHTAAGWSEAIWLSLWISTLGTIMGLVIWRVAYRRSNSDLS